MNDRPRRRVGHRAARRRGPGRPVAALGLLVLAVVLGACGGGDDESDAERTASPVPGFDYVACADDVAPPELEADFGETELATGDCYLVAETPAQRSQGLMGVTDLGDTAGMVFVFDQDVQHSFTMRDTPMPLSIAWFDAAGELVSTHDMEPCIGQDDCPSYSATGPYRFAVEVPQGQLEALGIVGGASPIEVAAG